MNSVTLVGRLGKDAELKYFEEGKNVLSYSLAVKGYGDKINWINCRQWNAEKVSNYMLKGKLVSVKGELQVDSYEKDGEKRNFTYVNVNNLELLSSKGDISENTLEPQLDPGGYGAIDDDDIPF